MPGDGEPFFQSLSESVLSSDPRIHAEAPVPTYSALSSRWRGLSVSDVRTCPTPYALDALAQPSNRNLAPSYRETNLLSKQLPCQVIAFIGYRCPASSEAFPLRLPSPVYHVLTCIHRKRSHAPEETGAVTVIQSFGDIRAWHSNTSGMVS